MKQQLYIAIVCCSSGKVKRQTIKSYRETPLTYVVEDYAKTIIRRKQIKKCNIGYLIPVAHCIEIITPTETEREKLIIQALEKTVIVLEETIASKVENLKKIKHTIDIFYQSESVVEQ